MRDKLKDNQQPLAIIIRDVVEEIAEPLLQIIGAVNSTLTVHMDNGRIQTNRELDMDDLYVLAMKIPIECVYVQTVINEYLSGYTISDILINNEVTGLLQEERKTPGDARERLRRAEQKMQDERLIVEARKQIATSLQGIVHRADKVYEGVKKVIDASMRDMNLNHKVA